MNSQNAQADSGKLSAAEEENAYSFPWEEPKDNSAMWRYSGNPIIQRHALPFSNTIFNSGVAFYQDKFYGVFRVDNKIMTRTLHVGSGWDGVNWQLDEKPIEFNRTDSDIAPCQNPYDPRIVHIGTRYYIIWCNEFHGPNLALGYTDDFKTFHQLECISLPFNRNGVLFPEKIAGKYAMLTRPCSNGHCADGEIFYSESPDLTHWGKFRYVMGPRPAWCCSKVGAGPAPIKTEHGWLLIYHGVRQSCNGYIYSAGAALLDLDKPWNVIADAKPFLFTPEEPYECIGDVPNVVFPAGLLHDQNTGRLAIYYGAADTCLALAFSSVDRLINFVKNNS